MSVLDHDDRGVDHRADRNRDAAEAHDVGADAESIHHRHGDEDADRQGDDRNQRTAHMQQEQETDQRHDHKSACRCRISGLSIQTRIRGWPFLTTSPLAA